MSAKPVQILPAQQWRIGASGAEGIERATPEEMAVGVSYDSEPYAVLMATPEDVADLALTTTLNGQVKQSASTSQMIVDIPSAIEFFSSFTRLCPGDVIATGTPGGVGFARTPPVWLQPGDVVQVSIDGVGTIRNRVVAEGGEHAGWRWRPGPPPSSL